MGNTICHLGIVGTLTAVSVVMGCNVVGEYEDREDWSHEIRQADDQTEIENAPETLKVLTWNMKFAGGRIDFWFDGYGERVIMTEAEACENMESLIALVREFDPDILLAQEIDNGSKRSAYRDMTDDLLQNTALNWSAWVPIWEADYILEQGLGPMKMGMSVLSKHEITENWRIALDPVSEQSALVQTFYLDRAIQRVTVDLGDGSMEVINNHPEAYSTDGTKIRHIEAMLAESVSVDGEFIVGGDFNAVPPGSLRLEGFGDEIEIDTKGVTAVDYVGEEELLAPFYEAWNPAISLDEYQVETEEEQETFHTHSIDKDTFWTRKLDYLFATGTWDSAWTVQSPEDTPGGVLDPMQLSDHCPVFGTVRR